jgi:spermidine synthase
VTPQNISRTLSIHSFCLAAISMLFQLIFAQLLAAELGGTSVQYALMVGLYTFSLGAGSLLCVHVEKIRNNLLKVEIAILSVSLLGYLWLRYGLSHFNTASPSYLIQFFAYLPLVLLGLLSGNELPLLMNRGLAGKDQYFILSADYLGMLAVSLGFPLLLWPYFGISGAFLFALVCQICIVFSIRHYWAEWAHSPQTSSSDLEVVETSNKFSRVALLKFTFLASLLSFCSLLYELTLAKMLEEITDNAVLSQSVGIGIYLLGLGLGALHFAVKPLQRNFRTAFFSIETRLMFAVTVGGALVLVSKVLSLAILGESPTGVALGWAFHCLAIVMVGYYSGFELPLLLEWSRGQIKNRIPTLIASSSLGALAAGFLVPLYLLGKFSPESVLLIGVQINILVALPLLLSRLNRHYIAATMIGVLSVTSALFMKHLPTYEQAYLKTYYYNLRPFESSNSTLESYWSTINRIDPIQRIRTIYQNIDIVNESAISTAPGTEDFSLYINKKPQLSTRSWRIYHDSYPAAFENLFGSSPPKVLILGGGDGILARVVHDEWPVAKIKLVELDAEMIQLASRHPTLTHLNRRVFDSDFEILIGDAFHYVRTTSEKFDAVFLDFPYPSDYDVAKLYSVEFYTGLKKILSENGIAILDAPLWQSLGTDGKVTSGPHICYILSTLQSSGFTNILSFGYVEPLIAVRNGPAPMHFDYSLMTAKKVSNQAFTNLHRIRTSSDLKFSKSCINSIYAPRNFEAE